ncbi:HPr family phosphocarrier protein [Hydrogenoanaerobacterium sp.]|uniref:HPr family phosphocarrier protein n=1 Tax=Hydrogenoanaerobacterium sp. TaxID=2953763 RepID=UPI0028A1AAA3|nr:HPr family phosphocarrier protein [Hydrogenoanaerobacterium sp.]
MKKFEYTIKDALGLHARPAGLLVKCASGYKSAVTLTRGDKSGDAKRLFAVMGLAVKCGDVISIAVDGEDEDAAYQGIKAFCESNL